MGVSEKQDKVKVKSRLVMQSGPERLMMMKPPGRRFQGSHRVTQKQQKQKERHDVHSEKRGVSPTL